MCWGLRVRCRETHSGEAVRQRGATGVRVRVRVGGGARAACEHVAQKVSTWPSSRTSLAWPASMRCKMSPDCTSGAHRLAGWSHGVASKLHRDIGILFGAILAACMTAMSCGCAVMAMAPT